MRSVWVALAGLGLAAGCGSKQPAEDAARAPDAAAVAAPADTGTPVAVVDAAPPPPSRVEHAVFSLVDNRHAAHRYLGEELVLDGADVGFARYTRFSQPAPRWRLAQTVDGVRAAVPDRVAVLEVPLDGKAAGRTTQVIARVRGTAKQRLALRINGARPTAQAKTSRVDLVEGWQTVSLPVEPGRFVVGENQIGLETTGGKGKLAVEWVRFGKAATGTDDPRGAIRFDAAANKVVLGKHATLVWYVTVPEGAHLVADVAGACKVEVQAIASDGSFAGGTLAGAGARVELARMAGRVVGLALSARECAQTELVAPEIRVLGAAPVVAAKGPPPRYVILWVMDALRADKVPAFTPGARAQTPHLDELARSSAVFRQYYVQGNESQTSHSSVWTGVYPAVHNVRLAGSGGSSRIPKGLETLAEKLAAAGFHTMGITGNGFVDDGGGYTRGFREYRNMMKETGVINGILYGEKILAAVLAKLEERRDQPLYLFFGTIDTHGPWIARKPWIDTYSPDYEGPFERWGTARDLGIKPDSMGCSIIPPPKDVERLRAIYDSAISYQDQLVGKLVAQLKSWGIWDQTMLVITADHGEEMFEDKRCGHGGSLRDSLVRVPLLIHDPGRFPGGTIVDEGAEGVDVLPTILDAVGGTPRADVQGASLVPLAQGVGRGWATPSYASMYEYAHAMRIGRWKIRVGPAGVPIVADLIADPEERTDLARANPVERRMLTDNLGLFLALRAQWQKDAWGVTTNVTREGAAALDRAQTP